MQIVFAVSAAAVFVPVLYHRTTAEETDSLNKDAPGAQSGGRGRGALSEAPSVSSQNNRAGVEKH